ncbi:MAG: LacI family DNA-binding transcriptional regulator [Fibrobacteres bacterium]|nr:LacI family DNA-binding transcriptional regulator [Fibrobacterota bacterium]
MKVTLDRIAEQVGLSKATVSKALRQSSDLNKDTITRVTDVALAMGYKPRVYGRKSLAKSINSKPPMSMVSLVFYKQNHAFIHDSPYFAAVINRLYKFFQASGVMLVESYPSNPDELARILSSRESEAAVFLSNLQHIEPETAYQMLVFSKQKPLILLGNYLQKYINDFPSVRADNFTAGYRMARYHLDKGIRHTIFVQCFPDMALVADRRFGFLKAVDEFNLQPNLAVLDALHDHKQAEVDKIRQIIAGAGREPVGFVSDGDISALVLIKMLKGLGIFDETVHHVTGIDGFPVLVPGDGRKATFRIDLDSMTRQAVELASRMHFGNFEKVEQILVSGDIIENRAE